MFVSTVLEHVALGREEVGILGVRARPSGPAEFTDNVFRACADAGTQWCVAPGANRSAAWIVLLIASRCEAITYRDLDDWIGELTLLRPIVRIDAGSPQSAGVPASDFEVGRPGSTCGRRKPWAPKDLGPSALAHQFACPTPIRTCVRELNRSVNQNSRKRMSATGIVLDSSARCNRKSEPPASGCCGLAIAIGVREPRTQEPPPPPGHKATDNPPTRRQTCNRPPIHLTSSSLDIGPALCAPFPRGRVNTSAIVSNPSPRLRADV